ncbi:MAG: cation-transporting P-type ATPase [Pseudonocardiales bacterium]|nr:cation-transporting P-type ATPase [Pseudonocardiales bacterium]
MSSTLTTSVRPTLAHPQPSRLGRLPDLVALPEVRWAALATVLFGVGGLLQVAGAPAGLWWASYLASYAAGGWEPGLAGLRALRDKTLDVDLLMIVAAIVAAAIGQVFDGALLIVIFATSGALESVATKRTADSVRALLELAPQQATRLRPDGGEELVDTADLAVGDLLLVRPGELIGADAEVVAGASEVAQASITGEPLPVLKQLGDEVFAGTLNGTGALRVNVNRPPGESVIARIAALVEEASATKARTQLFIEKVEQRYSLGIVAATLGLFFIPLTIGADLQVTLLRAMTFMIVASPCAVVLATMPPLLSAIATAGRNGVLVKSAVVMEQLGLTDTVAFDKTGTLTQGTPRVAAIHPLAGITEHDLLTLAAAAERPSEHPLAAAVVAAAHQRGLNLPTATEFNSTPGRGVTARVDGHTIQVGSPGILEALSAVPSDRHADVQGAVAAAETSGRTAVVVLRDGRPIGVLALADRLRPDAAATVAELAALTGHTPILLTGDNASAAQQLAADVGITDVHAGLLPADKVTHVHALQHDGRRVLLVGDGVNDAPALAAADLGIAMGGHGSDLALETADAVIVRDDLTTLTKVIGLSRRARRLVTANLVIAATVITGLVIWDLAGHLPLPVGVAGHESSTVIVGLNGLRLLRNNAWRRAGNNG